MEIEIIYNYQCQVCGKRFEEQGTLDSEYNSIRDAIHAELGKAMFGDNPLTMRKAIHECSPVLHVYGIGELIGISSYTMR